MALGWQKDYLRYKSFFLDILRVYNSKPNLKIYLELILSLAIISILSVAAIRPTALTIIDLQKEIQEKEATVAKLTEKSDNLEIANNLLNTETTKVNLIEEAVPSSSKVEGLIKQVETLASQYQLQITGFSSSDVVLLGKISPKTSKADPQKFGDNIESLPFTISVTGSYSSLFSFLTDLEKLRRPIKIDTLAINTSVTESGKVLVLTIGGRVPFTYEEQK